MYRDLLSKYKEGKASISQDYKSLEISYEFKLSVLSLFNKEKLIEIETKCLNGILILRLENNKYLKVKFSLESENLNLLYKVAIIITYILGDNIQLEYYYQNFPYYPTDIHFNLHNKFRTNRYLVKKFLEKPEVIIIKLLELLNEKKSVFSLLIPSILQFNAFPYIDMIFVVEYGLLQQLASEHKIAGTLFNKKSEEFDSLQKFSEQALHLLSKFPLIQEKIKHKLAINKLNERFNTKEKIKKFLEIYRDGRFEEYKEMVDEWNNMRRGVIVHGISSSGYEYFHKNHDKVDKLHYLLLLILEAEVKDKISKS